MSLAAVADVQPLKVLNAQYDSNQGHFNMGDAQGQMAVWLQNIDSVPVTGVKVEVELYNDYHRKIKTLTRKIGQMPAGKKLVLNFKWDVVGEDHLKPRIWVYYNGGGPKPVKMNGDPPSWGW